VQLVVVLGLPGVGGSWGTRSWGARLPGVMLLYPSCPPAFWGCDMDPAALNRGVGVLGAFLESVWGWAEALPVRELQGSVPQ